MYILFIIFIGVTGFCIFEGRGGEFICKTNYSMGNSYMWETGSGHFGTGWLKNENMWSLIVNITRVSNEKFYIGTDFVPGNNSNQNSNIFKLVTGSFLLIFSMLLPLRMTTRIKIKYTYKEFKMYRLKAKKSNYMKKLL